MLNAVIGAFPLISIFLSPYVLSKHVIAELTPLIPCWLGGLPILSVRFAKAMLESPEGIELRFAQAAPAFALMPSLHVCAIRFCNSFNAPLPIFAAVATACSHDIKKS